VIVVTRGQSHNGDVLHNRIVNVFLSDEKMNNGEAYMHNRSHKFFLIFEEGNEVASDVVGWNEENEMQGLYHIKVRLV
jgi:hypothetical protein